MSGYLQSSPRDARLRQFVANGPRWAGYKLTVDSEEDGDAFAASFDPFLRPENTETCFSEWDDDGRHLSLEALAAESGFAPIDPTTLDADDDREEDEKPTIIRSEWDAEDFLLNEGIVESRPSGATNKWWQSQKWQKVAKRAAVIEVVSRDVIRAERTAMAAVAKPEPAKGNGNGHKPVATPPSVGKFLTGTVLNQGPKGLLVDIGNGLEARVPIALEMGHGSWDAAAKWILGFKPGTHIRIRVIRVNGVIEAVLADRHPRPFWKKETIEQQAPAAN